MRGLKSQLLMGQMGGLGMRLRLSLFPGSLGWLSFWRTGIWPQGLLDAYIALIPKADGDSAPLGQRPLTVLREWVEVVAHVSLLSW